MTNAMSYCYGIEPLLPINFKLTLLNERSHFKSNFCQRFLRLNEA